MGEVALLDLSLFDCPEPSDIGAILPTIVWSCLCLRLVKFYCRSVQFSSAGVGSVKDSQWGLSLILLALTFRFSTMMVGEGSDIYIAVLFKNT